MVYIYILKLEKGKFYIGKTTNPNRRLLEHSNSEGANWTKMYKPIEVITIIQDCSHFDEDKYTLEYMSIYGIDNVRGGSFCNIFLSFDVKILLERMIRGSLDKCFICGEIGHFAKNCDNKERRDRREPYDRLLRRERIIPRIREIKSNSYSNTRTSSQITMYDDETQLSASLSIISQDSVNEFNPPITTSTFVPELIRIFNPPTSTSTFVPELIKIFNPPITNSVPELIRIFNPPITTFVPELIRIFNPPITTSKFVPELIRIFNPPTSTSKFVPELIRMF